jgi:hypothetical protein
MDWLYEIRGEVEKEIYYQVADLLNLEVDLLFPTPPPRIPNSLTTMTRSPGTGAAK